MNDTKRRHAVVTAWLWLVIIVNLFCYIYYIALLFKQSSVPEVLWAGFAAVTSLLTVLSAVLLMKWNKFGYMLFVISTTVYSIVGILGAQESYYTLLINLLPILFWWLILQIRKDGKSAWSMMKNGLDYKHCRHIYQLFGILAAVVVVCTLIPSFTLDKSGGKTDPVNPVSDDLQIDTLLKSTDKDKKARKADEYDRQQKLSYDTMSVEQLWQVLNNNTKDSEALYRLAKYYDKRDSRSDQRVRAFWNNTLVPDGDVQNCLPVDKRELTSVRFVFVMLARSYSNLPDSADQEMRNDIIRRLEHIKKNNSGYKY